MNGSKELQTQPKASPTTTVDVPYNSERFSDLNANIVIIVLTIVAFVPAFLDADFYDPLGRFIVSIILGCGYGLMATYGTSWHEDRLTWWSAATYFVVQTGITFTLLYINDGVSNNFWLLLLPLTGQAFSVGLWKGSIAISVVNILLFSGLLTVLNFDEFAPNFFRILADIGLNVGSAMLFVMFFTFIALREGLTRREMSRLASDLKIANHRLAEYAGQVEELATTRERNRLAREIHDNLGHYLTVVNVQIEAARAVLETDPYKSEDALAKAQRLTQEGLQSVRQSVSALRESPLGERPLTAAISDLIEETRTTGVQVSLTVNGKERPLSPKVSLTLYRIVQEGLTNIRKHAQATTVSIQIDYTDLHRIDLSLTDDGIGSDNPSGGFGLVGLRERIQLLGGHITFDTAPQQGFIIKVTLPFEEKEVE
ncbi:MAG: sensor histidine kinase [Chloroflexota bacterium]